MKTEKTEIKKKSKYNFKDFIDSNNNLLTTFSIFIALTIFSNQINIDIIADILSFLFLAIAIRVWFELLNNIPQKKTTIDVQIFAFGLLSLTVLLILLLLIQYINYIELVFFIILTFCFVFLLIKIIVKYDVIKRILPPKLFQIRLFRIIMIIILNICIILGSVYLSLILKKAANPFITEFKKDVEKFVNSTNYKIP